MVSRVTSKRDPSTAADLGPTTAQADQIMHRLAELVDEDMAAFLGVLESRGSGAGAVEPAL
jgi:formiminotetrahydrofolate cyclodeaminase